MTARGTGRMPGRLYHSSSRDNRRAWDGVPPASTLLSGGSEVALSGIKIGLTSPGPGTGDILRLRYRPEAYCISFEGPNSRGMLVPLEEMLLKDNLDGTISVFFRRQFRRKYYTLEGSSPRACDHIQAFKNELNQELHMLCFVTGYEPLTSAANFVRKVKQGRQNIPLPQRSSNFPAYTNYHHPQPHISIPVAPCDFDGHLDELSQSQYRRNSYYAEPEMTERRHSTSGNSSGTEGGPRVRFRDHPPPPVPQPPLIPPRVPLRGGGGPPPGQFRDYDYEEQFVRDPRDARDMRNGSAERGEKLFTRDPRNPRRSRAPVDGMNGFESPPPRNPTPSPRDRDPRYPRGQSAADGNNFEQSLPPRNSTPAPGDRYSREQSAADEGRTGGFEQPLPPRSSTPAPGPRYSRSHPAANGAFEPPPPPPTPAPQKRMFALVFRRSPVDQSFEIRPASIDSSHEALVRQARNHWNLREMRLYGHVDGLKMNLNSQVDLEAYLKLCDGMQRLMVDVE